MKKIIKKFVNILNTFPALVLIYRKITENIFLIQTILDLITNIL